jgi:hypothetical protein
VRRRILINFRADPGVVQPLLPPPFRPKLVGDSAIVGLCLIRLERIRPTGLPAALGLASENAAHRIAVTWGMADGQPGDGVYIPRRDTATRLNALAGGRLFPGDHELAHIDVEESDGTIDFLMRTPDGAGDVRFRARSSSCLPTSSTFPSLDVASRFFREGDVGYSATREASRLDGLRLHTSRWHVEPLEVTSVYSAYYSDSARFPPGSLEFDCALLMRDVPHEWQALPSLYTGGRRVLRTEGRRTGSHPDPLLAGEGPVQASVSAPMPSGPEAERT